MRKQWVFALFLMLLVLLPVKNSVAEEKQLWELGMGGALLMMPEYRVSDEYRIYPLPYPYFVYRGENFKVNERRIIGKLFKTNRIILDFSIYGFAPIKSSNNAARTGMPDLDHTFGIGSSLIIFLTNTKKLSLKLPVRAFSPTNFSSLRREGWIFRPHLEFKENIANNRLILGISTGPMFTESSYNAYFYTVESVFAAA
jgi:outer membrane protein